MGRMNLPEYEGALLFKKYGIKVPKSKVFSRGPFSGVSAPAMVKAQVTSGDRKKAGGVLSAKTKSEITRYAKNLLSKKINGEVVKKVLVAEQVSVQKEYYLSFSYDTDVRTPVFAVSLEGGTGVASAQKFPIDMSLPLSGHVFRSALAFAKFPQEDIAPVAGVAEKLWRCFIGEHALLAEINPLVQTKEGAWIAVDAKVILDDEKINPGERRYIDMDGDVAILASGGGASLLNIDTLYRAGGRPANYTEYSGNPPREVVRALTKKVLSKKGLKGCWVVGGTANFTDIFETLSGFVEGLRQVSPKPRYPIVIRRDGPRQEEAFHMLRMIGEKEGYDFHLYGRETDMAESARILARLIQEK